MEVAACRNSAGRILARRKTRASNVSKAMWQGSRRDHSGVRNNAPRGRGRQTRRRRGARRPAGQFANSSRGACSFGSRGAAQQHGPHPCTEQDKIEQHEQRDVAMRTARSQRRAQTRAVSPRATDAKKRGARRPAGQRRGRRTRRGRGGKRPAAMPAENPENSLRVWHAARAALDAATQRKRGPQPCRTSNAMWEGAWREHSVLRNNAA